MRLFFPSKVIFSIELNSEEYLQKGIHIPIPRLPHYQNYWREYRWPTLVCKELGYNQYNIHDKENEIKIGADSVNTLWMMVRDEDKIEALLAKTKYVIFKKQLKLLTIKHI